MIKSMKRIKALSKKEFVHIIRDSRTLMIVILMPLIQLLLFGYAFDFELSNVNLRIVDYSNSSSSERLFRKFAMNDFFHCEAIHSDNPSYLDSLFQYENIHAIIIIPWDFEKKIMRGNSSVQCIIDGSNSNTALMVKNYIQAAVQNYNKEFNINWKELIDIRSSIFFNPDRDSSYFFVPGIIALILVMISALLTSIAISKEKETGTMEQLLVSPVHPHEIIIGKVIPYILLAFLDGAFILLVGVFLFHVPIIGNLFLLVALTLLYIITALGLGLLISTRAKTQQVAMMIALTATLLPTLLLSGFVFPIVSMPFLLKIVTYLVPAKYYLLMIRGIMLKNSGLINLIEPVSFLFAMCLLILIIAIKRFKMTNDF